MQKRLILLMGLLIILVGILVFFSVNILEQTITGATISELNTYSYTKAMCEGNSCQDYEIVCKGDELISMTPITGVVIMSQDWEDPRDDEMRNRFCG